MEAGGGNDLVEKKCGVKNKGINLEEVNWWLKNKGDDLLRDGDDEEIKFHEESM